MNRTAPIKRSTFRSKVAHREPKRMDGYEVKPRAPAAGSGLVSALACDRIREQVAHRPLMKTPDRKSQAIRDSARGEDCLVRLPGCPSDPAMTIWSHNRHQRAGKGGAIKALDLNGCYCCTYCDAIYDGQAKRPAGMTREAVELAWYHAHAESLVRARQKGVA